MVDVIVVFSIVAAIIVISFLGNIFFKKTRFPDTLFLIIVGVLLGPVLGILPREELMPVTTPFVALGLIIILFEGGLNMEMHKVITQSFRAAVLGILYVTMATLFVSVFSYFFLGFGLLEALILGPMTAGTSSIVIIPLISKLKIKEEVGVTLSLESTVTDVLNIILVIAFLQIYLGSSSSLQQIASTIVGRFSVGIFVGFVIGMAWTRILIVIRRQEYTYMLTVAALISCYVSSEYLGGSGALAALLFGLVLGNHELLYRILGSRIDPGYMSDLMKSVRIFQGEIAFLVRAFFFVFLGLVYMPYWIGILYAGAIVGVNLVLRYLAATAATFRSDLSRHRKLMTLMCGTGLANATLAVLVFNTLTTQANPVPNADLYPLIVTNTIIISNIVTAVAPILFGKETVAMSDLEGNKR